MILKVWRTDFVFLSPFSWSWEWLYKRRQILNYDLTTSVFMFWKVDLNFGAFYYIIDNFSCSSKFKCWRETTSPPHFELKSVNTNIIFCCLLMKYIQREVPDYYVTLNQILIIVRSYDVVLCIFSSFSFFIDVMKDFRYHFWQNIKSF